jgi:hypothetical protein
MFHEKVKTFPSLDDIQKVHFWQIVLSLSTGDPFQKADEEHSQQFGGAGLELTLRSNGREDTIVVNQCQLLHERRLHLLESRAVR